MIHGNKHLFGYKLVTAYDMISGWQCIIGVKEHLDQ